MDTELQYEPNEPQREPAQSTGDEKRRIITAERLSLALSIAALACFGLVLFAALPTISGMEAGMLVALLSIFVVAVSNIFVSRSGLNPFWIILMIGTLWVGTIGITLLH